LNYRVPGGENFYDLKGRVTREFWRVWKQDTEAAGPLVDMVVVAHLGVIRALAEDLGGSAERVATGSVTLVEWGA